MVHASSKKRGAGAKVNLKGLVEKKDFGAEPLRTGSKGRGNIDKHHH